MKKRQTDIVELGACLVSVGSLYKRAVLVTNIWEEKEAVCPCLADQLFIIGLLTPKKALLFLLSLVQMGVMIHANFPWVILPGVLKMMVCVSKYIFSQVFTH